MILFVILFVMDGASVTDTIEVVEDSLVDTRFEIMNGVKVYTLCMDYINIIQSMCITLRKFRRDNRSYLSGYLEIYCSKLICCIS